MTFESHNNAKISKIYGALDRIRHTKKCIPKKAKKEITSALIDPVMDYGDVVSYGWQVHGTMTDEARILVADNDKIRYVCDLRRHDHITESRRELNMLTPENRAKLHAATLIFKIVKGDSPSYLDNMVVVRSSNTRSNGNLRPTRPITTFDKRAFSYSAINFYNQIPNEIKNATTVNKFKDGLGEWLRHLQNQ